MWPIPFGNLLDPAGTLDLSVGHFPADAMGSDPLPSCQPSAADVGMVPDLAALSATDQSLIIPGTAVRLRVVEHAARMPATYLIPTKRALTCMSPKRDLEPLLTCRIAH